MTTGDDGRGQPPHRRPRAPGHLPLVPPGRRPPVPALRRRRPRSSPTTSTPSTCRPSSPLDLDLDAVRRCSTTTPTSPSCLVEHGRTRPGARRSPSTGSATAPTARCGAASCWWPTSRGFERVGHLRAGRRCRAASAAIREPWRMAVAWAGGRRASSRRFDDAAARRAVADLVGAGPGPGRRPASGRLFDAVAALLGLRAAVTLRGPGRHRAGGRWPARVPRSEAPGLPVDVDADGRPARARPAPARRRRRSPTAPAGDAGAGRGRRRPRGASARAAADAGRPAGPPSTASTPSRSAAGCSRTSG